MGQLFMRPGCTVNHVEIWLKRRKVSWWAIWTRENYEGEGRANHLRDGTFCRCCFW
jgi:hypothetical protein